MLRRVIVQMSSMSNLKASLLIVDEDLGFASNAKQILETLGLNVSLGDPSNMDSLRGQAPDLMIIAAELPKSGSTGFSWCNRLRKEKSFIDTRILITSDGSSEEALSHHTQIPERADAYANKPISDDELRREVIALLTDEYIQSEDEDSVAFISDEEVLEVEADISSMPPPLPEFEIDSWQAMNFDEMIRDRCELQSPTPPKQPNPDARMDYLRARVRFLEERDKATRSAWELIQEQGKDMERQAAASRFAAQRQYETLVETKKHLANQIEKYSQFNQKVSAVFEAKDLQEATLSSQLEQKNTELQRRQNVIAHLEEQLEQAKKKQAQLNQELADEAEQHKTETKQAAQQHDETMAQASQAHNEEIANLEDQHQQALEKQAQDHDEQRQEIMQQHEANQAELESEYSNNALLMETEHTGLILELTNERELMLSELEAAARNELEQLALNHRQDTQEANFLALENLRESKEHYESQILISQTRTEQLHREILTLRESLDDRESQNVVLRQSQKEQGQSNLLFVIENEQLRQQLASQEQQLRNNTSELGDLREQNQERQNQIGELEVELSERYLELEDLQSEISMVEAKQEDRLEQQKSSEKKWKEAEGQNARLDAQIQTLSTQLNASKDKLKQTEDALHKAEEEATTVPQLEQELYELTQNLSKQSQIREKLEEGSLNLKIQLGHSKAAREQLEAEAAKSDSELQNLQELYAREKEEKNTALRDKEDLILELRREQEEQNLDSQKMKAQLLDSDSKLEELGSRFDELQLGFDDQEAALEQAKLDYEQVLKEKADLTKKSENAIAALDAIKAEYKSSASELEGEISDTQESLFAQLEQIASLRSALEELEGERTQLKAENTTVSARLNGAIKRIDELEGHLLESETRAQQTSLELEEAMAERNHARAELAQSSIEAPDTEKPMKVIQAKEKAPIVEKSGSQKLNRVLRQAERAIERELDRRTGSNEVSGIDALPTRLEESAIKTTTEADLPEAYFATLEKYRSRASSGPEDYVYLGSDDASIIEIDDDQAEEEDDDTNVHLGEAGIQNTELESAMGIQSPVEEDTSPFGELMSSLGSVPAQQHFVRPHIEDPIAALQALEYSTGQIESHRNEDPFVHISELPWKALRGSSDTKERSDSNEERKTTDVLHVDELD